jgi:hypothetical protein
MFVDVFGFPRLNTFAVVFTRLSAWLSAPSGASIEKKNPCYFFRGSRGFSKSLVRVFNLLSLLLVRMCYGR